MGLITCLFEGTAQVIGSALSVTASSANTSILKLGDPTNPSSKPWFGVLLNFQITQAGGATDSDLTVDLYLSFDGTNVDTEKLLTFDILSAPTGTGGTHRFTRMFRVDEDALGLGYACRLTLIRKTGDRTLTVTVNARKMWRHDQAG